MLDNKTSGRSTSALPPILELSGVHKHFGGVHALRGADFQVSAGEVVALVGDNGAGKSTLVKIIAGVHQPDDGQIVFEGRPAKLRSPEDANRLGIETVYQDLALCDNLDVVGNMFLGRELGRPLLFSRRAGRAFHYLSEREMANRAHNVLEELHVRTITDVRTVVESLSGGQRQAIAIARAVMWNSKIVMLDEPTAALGVEQTKNVLDLVVRLRNRGLGVILISHNLHHVFEVADRIDVLRLGRRVMSAKPNDTNSTAVVHAITAASSEDVGSSDYA